MNQDVEVLDSTREEQSEGILKGLNYCITGKFSVPREVIKELIFANGGLVHSSVTKVIDIVLVGTDAGSKQAKAIKLGKIISSYDELLQKLEGKID